MRGSMVLRSRTRPSCAHAQGKFRFQRVVIRKGKNLKTGDPDYMLLLHTRIDGEPDTDMDAAVTFLSERTS